MRNIPLSLHQATEWRFTAGSTEVQGDPVLVSQILMIRLSDERILGSARVCAFCEVEEVDVRKVRVWIG